MFSLNIQMPKFGRRRSQPPSKDKLSTLNELPVVSLKSSRARSVDPSRMPRKSRLAALGASEGYYALVDPESSIPPHIVDIEPKDTTPIPFAKRYHSLPAKIRHSNLDAASIRGRLPHRQESLQALPGSEQTRSSTFYNTDYHTSYDRKPQRELSSDSSGRCLIVERSRSRQPRHTRNPERSQRAVSGTSEHSRSRSAAPIIHSAGDRSSQQRPRSGSRRSRISEVSGYSPSPSETESMASYASTASTAPSLKVDTKLSGKYTGRLEKLSAVFEPSSDESTKRPSTTTTRYRYRYTPVEDDVASIKSFVREIEKGGKNRQSTSPTDITAKPTADSGSTDSSSYSNPGTANTEPSTPPRSRRHGRSVSHGDVGLPKSLPTVARHVRSVSIAPSTTYTPSSAIFSSASQSPQTPCTQSGASTPPTTESVSTTNPLPTALSYSPARPSASGTRPKFTERFSIYLDEPRDTNAPSVISAAESQKESSDGRRMRRVNRVLKMAEYAAGRR